MRRPREYPCIHKSHLRLQEDEILQAQVSHCYCAAQERIPGGLRRRKTIKRKIPLQGKTLLDKDFYQEEDDIAFDSRTRRPTEYAVPLHPQQKVYPEGTSKNMLEPTGFEDAYESPVTPAEGEEEDRMYDEDKTFIERIEIAIQCFKQKRRMHKMYSKVFNKLMRYGGVESGDRACIKSVEGRNEGDGRRGDCEGYGGAQRALGSRRREAMGC